jgi:parallel beta-helix repeat protein
MFWAVNSARGNTYYFSAGNGDDSRTPAQAMQASTPWRTLGKLNQVFGQLQPGDSVLFKRGEVFYGPIVAGRSGVAGRPIVLAAYGQGYDPIISGFARLGGWKSGGKGIWQAPCQGCGLRVNMVTIEDTVQPMGRFPNSGYFKIQSHVTNSSLTDPNLAGGPDWTGADVVIRKNRFILDRNTVISQQGSTLNYRGGSFYPATDKFGYFIQNDIRALDQPGEWYYDPKSKTMNIYFGSGQPAADILASSIDTLVSVRNKQYLVFKGLTFQGSNGNAFFLSDAANITISYCRILFSSLDGVCAIRSTNLTLMNLAIDHSDDNGISIMGTGSLVTDCTVRHSGNVPGMGNPEHSYIGINIDKGSSNNTVQYNTVDTSGYVGILFLGGPTILKNNTVDYFCYLKDDGGGVYTWSGDIDSATPRKTGVVTGNIVLNGITAEAGTDNLYAIADGIYLDENTGEIEVSNNTVAHCTSGIFVQDSHEAVVKNNTLYDNGAQIEIRHALMKGTLRNNEISSNTAVAAKPGQTDLLMSSAVSADLSSYANLHDNYYGQVAGSGPFFQTSRRQDNRSVQDKGALTDFQARYGKEANSVVAPPATSIRFEYNASKGVKTVTLNRTYTDPAGKTYQGSLRLAPYTSAILMPK